jgi:hypothetical protein
MTCHCQSKEEHAHRAVDNANYTARQRDQANAARIRELQERSPDPDEFTIEDLEQVGHNLVLKVRYPGCARCDFDRCKVMVYIGIDLKAVVRWRRIDPHFRAPQLVASLPGRVSITAQPACEAPSPVARFPASAEGWADALDYAKRKDGAR